MYILFLVLSMCRRLWHIFQLPVCCFHESYNVFRNLLCVGASAFKIFLTATIFRLFFYFVSFVDNFKFIYFQFSYLKSFNSKWYWLHSIICLSNFECVFILLSLTLTFAQIRHSNGNMWIGIVAALEQLHLLVKCLWLHLFNAFRNSSKKLLFCSAVLLRFWAMINCFRHFRSFFYKNPFLYLFLKMRQSKIHFRSNNIEFIFMKIYLRYSIELRTKFEIEWFYININDILSQKHNICTQHS